MKTQAKEIIPIFNTDVYFYQQELNNVESLYLTVKDGHVIRHKSSGGPFGVRPEVIGRFENNEEAEKTLFAAGYVKNMGRFVYYPK